MPLLIHFLAKYSGYKLYNVKAEDGHVFYRAG